MSKKIKKVRLDLLLVDRGISQTRERARALIMSGAVLVGEAKMDKAGSPRFPGYRNQDRRGR